MQTEKNGFQRRVTLFLEIGFDALKCKWSGQFCSFKTTEKSIFITRSLCLYILRVI